ncbi:pilus assembly protein N-terminal domain-containing protein [Caulobacter sp.]|uniref:pilus assembly protein N-terminal domain-containing protein n=1 Tax=Caulobacter sp. TaxID=78 RepID=UPI002B4940AD|nr:pilus assembly protein N-terminal domain-containing protein [Caulobacter sp.]HJV43638.1 pilus assembly protein N-terminal domain-containing protein [Caulobacter sp.]
MRRFSLAIVAVLALSTAAAQAQPRPVDLPVASGQTASLSLGEGVRDIVVGDPSVADVSVVGDRTLIVMGKRPGVTSLLAFGVGGRALASRQVVVSEVGAGAVTVYRGAAASHYACAPQCSRVGVTGGTTAP